MSDTSHAWIGKRPRSQSDWTDAGFGTAMGLDRVQEGRQLPNFLDRFRQPASPEDAYRRAAEALDERRLDEALEGMQDATRAFPHRWEVWFDLGLVHKLRREWTESVAANRRAAELGQAKESFYNLGVAATAIRDWDSAMYAWHGLGLDVGP